MKKLYWVIVVMVFGLSFSGSGLGQCGRFSIAERGSGCLAERENAAVQRLILRIQAFAQAFVAALKAERYADVDTLIERNQELLDQKLFSIEKTNLVLTPFLYVVRMMVFQRLGGYIRVVKKLLEAGADVTICDQNGYGPMHYAAAGGQVELCYVLLERGADVNAAYGPTKQTPLHLAVIEKNRVAINWLHENGAAMDAKDSCGRTPLHYACRLHYTVDIVRSLVAWQADVTAADLFGMQPIHYACGSGYWYLIHWLGGDQALSNTDNIGSTALHFAAGKSIDAVMPAIKSILTQTEESGASLEQREATVKEILSRGVDPCLRDQEGMQALDYANMMELGRVYALLMRAEGVGRS